MKKNKMLAAVFIILLVEHLIYQLVLELTSFSYASLIYYMIFLITLIAGSVYTDIKGK